jgi:ubiquinone/menaquinone biosynthesis C-methylase UbiE
MEIKINDFYPPIIEKVIKKYLGRKTIHFPSRNLDSKRQDLDLYWNKDFANILEKWGEDHVWNEIQLLMINLEGRVLDIACGTGTVIKKLQNYRNLELYGFDISDLLIQRAISKGIPPSHLAICDATKTHYEDDFFNFSYSIGSLEHFTLDGIDRFILECARYTKTASFHMLPVSRSGRNEGWMKTSQSFHNNSEKWWIDKFLNHFNMVYTLKSSWNDEISQGRWVVCFKKKMK